MRPSYWPSHDRTSGNACLLRSLAALRFQVEFDLVPHEPDVLRDGQCAADLEVVELSFRAHSADRPKNQPASYPAEGDEAIGLQLNRNPPVLAGQCRTKVAKVGASITPRVAGGSPGTEPSLRRYRTSPAGALTRDQPEPCAATRILSSLNVSRESILDQLHTDADAIEGDWHIPFTPLAKKALDRAWRETSVLGGD